MNSFIQSGGIRVKDKFPVEMFIQYPIKSMVDNTVADRCFMYVPLFLVADYKMRIAAVAIAAAQNIVVKPPQIGNQIHRKFGHVRFVFFAPREFPPARKQIFFGKNFFEWRY